MKLFSIHTTNINIKSSAILYNVHNEKEDEEMFVEITQDEYKKLLKCKLNYAILLRGVIGASALGICNDTLVFKDEELDKILNLLEPESYYDRIQELRKKQKLKKEE